MDPKAAAQVDALVRQALFEVECGNHAEAATLAQQALQIDPYHAVALKIAGAAPPIPGVPAPQMSPSPPVVFGSGQIAPALPQPGPMPYSPPTAGNFVGPSPYAPPTPLYDPRDPMSSQMFAPPSQFDNIGGNPLLNLFVASEMYRIRRTVTGVATAALLVWCSSGYLCYESFRAGRSQGWSALMGTDVRDPIFHHSAVGLFCVSLAVFMAIPLVVFVIIRLLSRARL